MVPIAESRPRALDHTRPAHQVPSLIVGSLGLFVGALFYAVARHAGAAPWEGVLASFVWGSFPSFVHVLAMSFLTFAFLPARRITLLAVGGGWLICNAVYEWASHAGIDGFGLNFTGDPLDVAAAAAAAVAFWLGAGFAFLPSAIEERGEGNEKI